MDNNFQEFCNEAKIENQKTKIDSVVLFIWFYQKTHLESSINIATINKYFLQAHLPAYNVSYLKRDLTTDKRVTKGDKVGTYKLTRAALNHVNERFGMLFNENNNEIPVRVNIGLTPFLNTFDLDNARKMSELYQILHCWENSVRHFIEKILLKEMGNDWWEKVKNSDLERKLTERKAKEDKLKWISNRGSNSPLFYLDWGDLVKIIKKKETWFLPYVNDIQFIEHRLDELERLRNVIAHNGSLPDQNDIDRIVVHFNDWCKQLQNIQI